MMIDQRDQAVLRKAPAKSAAATNRGLIVSEAKDQLAMIATAAGDVGAGEVGDAAATEAVTTVEGLIAAEFVAHDPAGDLRDKSADGGMNDQSAASGDMKIGRKTAILSVNRSKRRTLISASKAKRLRDQLEKNPEAEMKPEVEMKHAAVGAGADAAGAIRAIETRAIGTGAIADQTRRCRANRQWRNRPMREWMTT
jgi:hypothetical protein